MRGEGDGRRSSYQAVDLSQSDQAVMDGGPVALWPTRFVSYTLQADIRLKRSHLFIPENIRVDPSTYLLSSAATFASLGITDPILLDNLEKRLAVPVQTPTKIQVMNY